MRKRTIARVLAVALGAALALGALAGCQSPATGATDQQQANRTYMTKVNQAVEELNTRLGEFDEAVAQESVVNMRNKANSAFEAIDALAAIDTPDAMKDLQTNYVDGCNKLKDALNYMLDQLHRFVHGDQQRNRGGALRLQRLRRAREGNPRRLQRGHRQTEGRRRRGFEAE